MTQNITSVNMAGVDDEICALLMLKFQRKRQQRHARSKRKLDMIHSFMQQHLVTQVSTIYGFANNSLRYVCSGLLASSNAGG